MPPTPQYRWPLLCDRLGVDLWLKHENHTPVGAFKVRGGLVYFDANAERLRRQGQGVICATRGNHGQSIAFAAAKYGIPVTRKASLMSPRQLFRASNMTAKWQVLYELETYPGAAPGTEVFNCPCQIFRFIE